MPSEDADIRGGTATARISESIRDERRWKNICSLPITLLEQRTKNREVLEC